MILTMIRCLSCLSPPWLFPPPPPHTQYLDVWGDATLLLGGPLLGVALVCWLLTASLWGAALLLLVLASLLVHLMGAMFLAGTLGWGRGRCPKHAHCGAADGHGQDGQDSCSG